jgi:hypothetical protein
MGAAMSYTSPAVGMGGSIRVGSDHYACTIVAVESKRHHAPHRVVVQQDRTEVTEEEGREVVKYFPRPGAECEAFTLRKNGNWVREGDMMKNGTRLSIGERYSYRDPSF